MCLIFNCIIRANVACSTTSRDRDTCPFSKASLRFEGAVGSDTFISSGSSAAEILDCVFA